MRKIPVLVPIFALCPLVGVHAQSRTVETVILDQSSLEIKGSSNVNDFDCRYNEPIMPDTLYHEIEIEPSEVKVKGDNISMYVESFDCGKKGINRDFRKTLKSNEYPTIDVTLERLIYDDDQPVIAEVLIYLAGISRMYQLDFTSLTQEEGTNRIHGSQIIKMSDFNLEPPKALFGLVKVNDEMTINFTLNVRQ